MVDAAGRAMAAAFERPEEPALRNDRRWSRRQEAEVFVAREAGVVVRSMIVTPVGDRAGLWSMATLPTHRRQGAGAALVGEVMARKRAEAVRLFYLCATVAGKALAGRIGFRTVSEIALFVTAG